MPPVSSLVSLEVLIPERRNTSMRGDSKSPLSVNLLLLLTSLGLLISGSQQEESLAGTIIDPDSQEEVGLLFHNRDREIVCCPGDSSCGRSS